MSAVPPVLAALSALSEAAGWARARGEEELAARCSMAAAGLQVMVGDALSELDFEEDER